MTEVRLHMHTCTHAYMLCMYRYRYIHTYVYRYLYTGQVRYAMSRGGGRLPEWCLQHHTGLLAPFPLGKQGIFMFLIAM